MVSTALGGDRYSTLPLVIVLFNMLVDEIEKQIFELDQKINRSDVEEFLILAFQSGRDKMLKHYKKTNWLYCACFIIDPRHKMETFEISSWGREMTNNSMKKFLEIFKSYCTIESSSCSSPEIEMLTNVDPDTNDLYNELNKYYKNSRGEWGNTTHSCF